MQDTQKKNFVQVNGDNIKKCVLDSMSDLVGKVEWTARKPWIAQEISKMDEQRK